MTSEEIDNLVDKYPYGLNPFWPCPRCDELGLEQKNGKAYWLVCNRCLDEWRSFNQQGTHDFMEWVNAGR